MPQFQITNPFESIPQQGRIDPISLMSFVQQQRRQQELTARQSQLDSLAVTLSQTIPDLKGLPITSADDFDLAMTTLRSVKEMQGEQDAAEILGESLNAFKARKGKLDLETGMAEHERSRLRGQAEYSSMTRQGVSLLGKFGQTADVEPAEGLVRAALEAASGVDPSQQEEAAEVLERAIDRAIGLAPDQKPFGDIPGPALEKFPELRPYFSAVESAKSRFEFLEKRADDAVLLGTTLSPEADELMEEARQQWEQAEETLNQAYEGMLRGRQGGNADMPPVPTRKPIAGQPKPSEFTVDQQRAAIKEAKKKLPRDSSNDQIAEYAEFLLRRQKGK